LSGVHAATAVELARAMRVVVEQQIASAPELGSA
jgi:hypothetical protein